MFDCGPLRMRESAESDSSCTAFERHFIQTNSKAFTGIPQLGDCTKRMTYVPDSFSGSAQSVMQGFSEDGFAEMCTFRQMSLRIVCILLRRGRLSGH